MKLDKFFAIICLCLVAVNVMYFIKGVRLSDEVNYFEKELKVLKQSNVEYEQKIYELESLSKTASLAAQLDYDKFNEPIFIDKPQYAYKP